MVLTLRDAYGLRARSAARMQGLLMTGGASPDDLIGDTSIAGPAGSMWEDLRTAPGSFRAATVPSPHAVVLNFLVSAARDGYDGPL